LGFISLVEHNLYRKTGSHFCGSCSNQERILQKTGPSCKPALRPCAN
jgi:hypothetical protein